MKSIWHIGAVVAAAVISTGANAQTPAASTPMAVTPAAAAAVVTPPLGAVATVRPLAPVPTILRAGAPVPLKFMEAITTKGKTLRVGQRIQMEVAENVMLGSQVVIPVGTPAVGEITDVRNKGMWGKSGKINARALYARVNGRQIRLTGQIDDKGVAGGIGAAAVSGIVFLPAGFFMTGTSAKIPAGAAMSAFLDEDIQIDVAPPLAVVAPAANQMQTVTVAPAAASSPK